MPSPRKAQRQGQLTRERILDAAAVRFSMHPYDHVGLRNIAADVGVDVALVHRAFGSKEKLFAATLMETFDAETLLATGDRALSGHLAVELLRGLRHKKGLACDPLQMLVRSISHPQAGAIIRRHIQEDFLGKLSAMLPGPGDQRAALAAGCILGISIMRHVLQIDALKDGQQELFSPLLAAILDVCLGNGKSDELAKVAQSKGSPDTTQSTLSPGPGEGDAPQRRRPRERSKGAGRDPKSRTKGRP